MKPVYLAVLGTLALAATGCVGEFTTGSPPGEPPVTPPPAGADAGVDEPPPSDTTGDQATARALFEANVAPIMGLNCANGGCHLSQAPAFVSADPLTAYDTAISQRDLVFAGYLANESRLLINGSNGHQGAPVFTATDVDAIKGWLAQEKLDADNAGGVAVSALAEWSGCMTQENFDASGFGDLFADKGTNQGDCDACHNTGESGFLASNQNVRMFGFISGETTKSALFMPSYFTLDATGTEVIINRARLEKVGNQIAPHEAHANYSLNNDDAMQALEQFYAATKALKDAGTCLPPRF